MGKKLGVLLAVMMALSIFVAGCAPNNEIKKPEVPDANFSEVVATDYPSLLDALAQFPYPYEVPEGYVLGTWVGIQWPGHDWQQQGYDNFHVQIITRDARILVITIVGDPVDIGLLYHDIRPNTGKYKFWYPVLLFREQPPFGDKYFYTLGIDIVGRFHIQYDRNSPSPNKVMGYDNEMYHR